VYLEKYPKWSPYGIVLSMVLIIICFEEAQETHGCVLEAQICLMNNYMKDNLNAGNTLIDGIVIVSHLGVMRS
jgi:hypothetical protein